MWPPMASRPGALHQRPMRPASSGSKNCGCRSVGKLMLGAKRQNNVQSLGSPSSEQRPCGQRIEPGARLSDGAAATGRLYAGVDLSPAPGGQEPWRGPAGQAAQSHVKKAPCCPSATEKAQRAISQLKSPMIFTPQLQSLAGNTTRFAHGYRTEEAVRR